MARRPSSRDGFQLAIICALPLEYDAVYDSLDEVWTGPDGEYGKAPGDMNRYTTGRMANSAVVLLLLPGMGKVHAASAVASMRSSFSNLRFAFLGGICGAVPRNHDREVILGDVVISKTVIQYDFGHQYSHSFQPKQRIEDVLGRPLKEI